MKLNLGVVYIQEQYCKRLKWLTRSVKVRNSDPHLRRKDDCSNEFFSNTSYHVICNSRGLENWRLWWYLLFSFSKYCYCYVVILMGRIFKFWRGLCLSWSLVACTCTGRHYYCCESISCRIGGVQKGSVDLHCWRYGSCIFYKESVDTETEEEHQAFASLNLSGCFESILPVSCTIYLSRSFKTTCSVTLVFFNFLLNVRNPLLLWAQEKLKQSPNFLLALAQYKEHEWI